MIFRMPCCYRYVPPETEERIRVVLDKKSQNDPETIVWTTKPPARGGRRPATNFLNNNSGEVIGPARDCETEVDIFNLFFTQQMIEIVVKHTNARIRAFNETDPSKKMDEIDPIEFRALVGLFYFRAFFKWNYEDRKRIFNTAKSHPVFCSTMSLKRFAQILRFLSFDDKATRKDRRQYDNFCAMRELFEVLKQYQRQRGS